MYRPRYFVQTGVLKLEPETAEVAEKLRATSDLFNRAYREIVQMGWNTWQSDRWGLQKLAYNQIRNAYPTLPSGLVLGAISQAATILREAIPGRHGGSPAPLEAVAPVHYTSATARISGEKGLAYLASPFGRLVIPFLPDETIPNSFWKHELYSADLFYNPDTQEFFLKVRVDTRK